MARLLAAEVEAALAHALHHIAVAHLGAFELEAELPQEALQAEVRHDGGHHPAAVQTVLLGVGLGDDGHDLVAVDDHAPLVADHQPVGVAIERDADIGAVVAHGLGHGGRMGRAALLVDVGAVRADANLDHLGPEFVEGGGRDLVGGAVGAIDHHPEARQAHLAREGGLDDLDVARLGVVDPLHPAKIARGRQAFVQALVHEGFDLKLALVRQLVAVRPEQLDAVVAEGVVRGGDHHPEVGAHRTGHHGHRRRRQGAEQAHVHAHAGEAGHQGRLDHVAGEPRVLADHHQVAPVRRRTEQLAGRQADAQGDLGRHRVLVGRAADAVGAEIGALAHGDAFQASPSWNPVLAPIARQGQDASRCIQRRRSGVAAAPLAGGAGFH